MGSCTRCGAEEDLVITCKRIRKDGSAGYSYNCRACRRERLREPMRKLMARKYATPEGKRAILEAQKRWQQKRKLELVNG